MDKIFHSAFLSRGFRPFFFLGTVFAALIIALWVPWYLGIIQIPSALPPISWHNHELLFGYVTAIIAGFLLTAVPNWTGRTPASGKLLALLVAIWLLGRLAISFSLFLPPLVSSLVALSFLPALIFVVGRDIIAAGNKRNLVVIIVLGALFLAQIFYHLEFMITGDTQFGFRLALAIILVLVMLIAGRIVPNFTRNWIRRFNPGPEPMPFGRFDAIAMLVAILALATWVVLPLLPPLGATIAGLLFLGAGIIHLARLWRWQPLRVIGEPMLAVLHLAYMFIALGFIIAGIFPVEDGAITPALTVHTWSVGAIALMTLAVMTRVTKGHTGLAQVANTSTLILFGAMLVAIFARLAAALLPQYTSVLLTSSALGWIISFAGFALIYGPALFSARKN
ncbi:NnrS protein involved in response to NO [hydrothermal vent metagenome]|uniref:NnrS protein involved in response to NO n=1 Tax=hydrothermal vent metagenome TaxID=652676 RepID=A0A3B0UN78_9ZZZZ